jgi:hypothetical protein
MPKLQIEATALKHTDVNFVSLVKHGANRIPFRIIKEDNEMLDLGKIGLQIFRKADIKPAIVAVLVSKSADLSKIQPALEAAGLVMTQKSDTEAAFVFAQPGAVAGDRDGVLRLDADVALIVGGLADLPSRVQKDFCPWEVTSTSFMAVLNTEGFYSGMQMAMGALAGTVANIMKDADDPAAAAGLVTTAIDDFKGYMIPCINGIPVHAFKADVALQKANDVVIVGVGQKELPEKKPEDQTGVSASGLGAGNNADGSAYTEKAAVTKEEPSPVNAHQGRAPSSTPTGGEASIGVGTTSEPQGVEGSQGRTTNVATPPGEAPIGTGLNPEHSPVNDAQGRGDTSTVAGLMKGIEDALAAQVKAFRDEVMLGLTDVRKDVTGVATRLTGVEERTTKAEEAIGGTALGDASDDPPQRQSRSQKSEGPPPLLDTAFNRAA